MKKNVLALSLSAAMVAGAAVPAFAATVPAPAVDWKVNGANILDKLDAAGNSQEEVEYYDEIENADGTYGTNVYAVIGSQYKVTIPKVIVLKGQAASKGASTATYYVDVDGDIAGDKKVVVRPAASFDMKQAGKADVAATVTQAVDEFLASNSTATAGTNQVKLNDPDTDTAAAGNSETSGTVSATLTAGKWNGSFDFTIELAGL